jgi:hypothetical protein
LERSLQETLRQRDEISGNVDRTAVVYGWWDRRERDKTARNFDCIDFADLGKRSVAPQYSAAAFQLFI